MKTSHEKVKVARGPKRTAAGGSAARPPARPRLPGVGTAAARSRAPGPTAVRERPRGPRKARAPEASPVRDAGGGWSVATESARERAATIAMAALDKKAVALEILDVAGKVDYADFLVIMTGRSDRHAQALAQGIEDELRKKNVRPVAVEGLPNGSWVLMDFGDVVVHVFQDEARQLYDIEGLWLDARRLPVPPPEQP